jgi:SAM-dependent methyltransferase
MHLEARKYLERIKNLFPDFFIDKKVIDIGSGDINGNNRCMFENCEYTGVDVVEAPNVDLVCFAKDIPESLGQFDTVISSECFEHDMQIYKTLYRILELIKEGGLFVFTCASTNRKEHGTLRTSPGDSFSMKLNTKEWYPNYYQNLTMDDIFRIIRLQDYFDVVYFEHNKKAQDLYFYGIRNSNRDYDAKNYLASIFNKFTTDKNEFQHNYVRQYDEILSKFRYKPINILEIGVYKGQSFYGWRTAFPNAVNIVGIDINPSSKTFENFNFSMFVEIGDQSDEDFLKSVSEKYGGFDLIIDDGSHRNTHVIKSFETLFPLLNDKGLYIVEDTVCHKVPAYLDHSQPNHLTYFTKFLPALNQWNIDHGGENHYVDPFKINKKTDSPFELGIDKVEYGVSYIAIHKLVRTNWIKE